MKKIIIGTIIIAIVIMSQLKYPLDKITKTLIANEVREEMHRSIFDVMWKKVFAWETFFESIDGFDQTGATLSSNKVTILTDGDLNNESEIQKNASYNGILTWLHQSAFRSGVLMDSIAEVTAYITVGGVQGGSAGYGFKIVNDKIYGVVHNGTAETTVELQTVATSNYNIQARYRPGNKVIFFVADVEKGVITTGLPQNTNVLNTIPMHMYVKATEAAAKSLTSSYFQYMQYRHTVK